MTAAEQTYKRNENFVFRQIDYNLNEVGAFIWQNIKCKNSVTDLKDMILTEFDVTESQAEVDLDEFVNDLREIEAILPATACLECQCS
jgi:hypothetical protein